MKLLAKHKMLMLLVASRANMGTPADVVFEKMAGACLRGETTERPYRTRVPAKRAWLPAEKTEVRMTVFMKEAATADGGQGGRAQSGEGTYLNRPTGIRW